MTKTQERTKNTILNKVRTTPGLRASQLPLTQRTWLRVLEREGLIEYLNDGWHPTKQE